jgi:Tfp pilus assembly protein PilO
MEKILKNIHWFIILLAIYNIAMYYKESDERLVGVTSQQEGQKQVLEKSKKTQKEIQSFYKDIDQAKAKIEKVALGIEKTQQQLPSEVSDTENMGMLRRIAEDLKIKDLSIAPDKDDDRGFYIARKYKFKAKATYLQFLILFEKISESKRILHISDLSFKKLAQPQRGKIQLMNGEFTLEAYRHNAAFKEDRGFDKIENDFKNERAGVVLKNAKPRSKIDKAGTIEE